MLYSHKEYFGQLRSILLCEFSTFMTIFPNLSYPLLCKSAQQGPTHKQNVFLTKAENIQTIRREYEDFFHGLRFFF